MNRRLWNRKINRAKTIEKIAKKDIFKACLMVQKQTKKEKRRFTWLMEQISCAPYSWQTQLRKEFCERFLNKSPHKYFLWLVNL